VRDFGDLGVDDVAWAGGKGANLGELTRAGFPVPGGFVVGADAYREFLESSGLGERLEGILSGLDTEDTDALSAASESARQTILSTPLTETVSEPILDAYAGLVASGRAEGRVPVAVRSSATAEDTEAASFAGMNETFLNVLGGEELAEAVRACWASAFGARSVYYRVRRGFGLTQSVDVAVVVQVQIESRAAGVMFTIDPTRDDPSRLVIEGSVGLGESVVSGSVSPDRFVVDKHPLRIADRRIAAKEIAIEVGPDGGTVERSLSGPEATQPVLGDPEVIALAELGVRVEAHYGAPQDTEWAIDPDGAIWLLQSRPITAAAASSALRDGAPPATPQAPLLAEGLGAGPGVGAGQARFVADLGEAARLQDGDVLLAHMTSPDWVPLMRRASAIVTDSGGTTCHAAIVSRELGIPCVVGTGDATEVIPDGAEVTVDATRGVVFSGLHLPDRGSETPAPNGSEEGAPVTRTRILVNLSEPSQIERAAGLPVDGVGLLRAELMVLEALGGRHPRLLIEQGSEDELVDSMAGALRRFAEGFAPRPITYRAIDFRSNEFRGLEGGERFEPEEANPMIGYRGALRYVHEPDLFGLELRALSRVWDQGWDNLHLMLPFVRVPWELERCREQVEASGLLDREGFELWIMAEVPSVLFHLPRYARLGIAGISIGSNDLTQLLLGADRDSELVAEVFDETDEAVREYVSRLIETARGEGLSTSICGQAPSVHESYAKLLVDAGIDAISVNIDAVARTRRLVHEAESGQA